MPGRRDHVAIMTNTSQMWVFGGCECGNSNSRFGSKQHTAFPLVALPESERRRQSFIPGEPPRQV